MPDCLIIGDSLAVGIAQHRPDCVAMATTGITSGGWLAKYGRKLEAAPSGAVLISLGVNDGDLTPTDVNLRRLRARIAPGTRVYWILPPVNPTAQAVVREVAAKYQDVLVHIDRQLGPDRVHPTRPGYASLSRIF